MTQQIIQDWTDTQIKLAYGTQRDVRYRVYKGSDGVYQEICDNNGSPIHTLELPEGLALERSSYEVMARYVLADVVNA